MGGLNPYTKRYFISAMRNSGFQWEAINRLFYTFPKAGGNLFMLVWLRSVESWCLEGVGESSFFLIKHHKNIGNITGILCSDMNIKTVIRTLIRTQELWQYHLLPPPHTLATW